MSASSVNHPLPFSFPFQMASRRTSFPRLTASRHAEGNENNEIQRSSVTYARRAPSLNSHLYYLSGSKSTHPSLPPLSAALRALHPTRRCQRVFPRSATTNQQGRETYIRNGIALLHECPLLISFKLGLAGIGIFKRVHFFPYPTLRFTSLSFPFFFSLSFFSLSCFFNNNGDDKLKEERRLFGGYD